MVQFFLVKEMYKQQKKILDQKWKQNLPVNGVLKYVLNFEEAALRSIIGIVDRSMI